MHRFAKISLYATSALVGWTLLAYAVASFLTIERDLGKTDAIVVLGGSADYKKRAETAAALFREGVAPRIIVTNDGQKGGWDPLLQRNPFYFERTVHLLEQNGVPSGSIEVLPQTVSSTNDEAELISDTALSGKLRSATLVTSGFHTRRALWAFDEAARKRGVDTSFAVESPPDDNDFVARSSWWLRPSGWRNIPAEVVKLVYYRAVY